MDFTITKRRESRGERHPCWRIYANGRRTSLFIEKAFERPVWGQDQMFDLCHDTTGFIMTGALGCLMTRLSTIVGSFYAEPA
jgi:hypothetical protein